MDIVSEYQFTKKCRIDGGEGRNSLGVYEAFDPQLRADVAIKLIDKKAFRDPSEFFAEAQAMFRSDHPNVVQIKVASQKDDTIFLSMPLHRQGSLARKIANGPLPLRDVLRVGQQMLAGLGAIHARGTIHFDIKPSNILFSDENIAKIADFGQAREIGPNGVTLMPDRMYAPGTPPEAFANGRRGTVESDIFQAGLTLYRAINGEPLFERQFQQSAADLQSRIIKGKFPDRSAFLPHVPECMCRAVRKAMNVHPAKRFPSAAAFSNAIARITIANNWRTSVLPDDEMEWEASGTKPKCLVTFRKNAQKWEVSLYKDRQGRLCRWRTALWRSDMKPNEAEVYLSQLFDLLG